MQNHPKHKFKALTGSYEVERQKLTERSDRLEQEISTEQDKMLNADRFMAIVDRYTQIRELTPEIV